jgi:alanyl-tRNA synthetase
LAQRQPPRTSDEVRQAFVDFFTSRQHLELPSSSLVPSSNDPTVLLTTAGMQQMIPYMLGRARPPRPRLVSVQKCFRTTDIDEVGNQRNLTFFEMLGNFSIGDYFKREAIGWAWEFCTEWLGLPAERLWVTVHPTDDEAVELWLAIGFPGERIVRLEDNWWGPPGAEGPCGPDSEIYYDRGVLAESDRDALPGDPGERFLEIWNLVFMQYFQDREGVRTPLPRPNIDTGMGLERTTMVMQGAGSVYETDLFRPIIDEVARQTGIQYGSAPETDYALRVLADHGRGMTFLVGDGVTPGPEARGYILRRIIRRAVRYGRVLGIEQPFVGALAGRVIARMADRYPEVAAQRDTIVSILEDEERRFRQTLWAGETRLAEWISAAQAAGQAQVEGRLLFLLHDSFGFPYELASEVLADHGLRADRAGFDQAMAEQRERSRRAGEVAASSGGVDATLPPTEFLGYEQLTAEAELLALLPEERLETRSGLQWRALDNPQRELTAGDHAALILDRTPFYAEGGGQVGDRGVLRLDSGLFLVEDTQDDGTGRTLHHGRVTEGSIRLGAPLKAEVDRTHRAETTRHHTLTHILHQSLRDVLGATTQQRGSLVAPGVARFDFNYPGPLSDAQRKEVQDRINERVLADALVQWEIMSLEEARARGAIMIFGEKYSDRVRVVEIGDFSRELCGGTHVHHSAEVGTAVLLRETGIGSGLRRVELVAGHAGLEQIYRRIEDVAVIAHRLGVPMEEAARRVDELLGQLDEARREIQRLSAQLASRQAGELAGAVQHVDGIQVLATRLDEADQKRLTEHWDALRDRLKSGVVFLGGVANSRTALLVGVTPDLRERGLDAANLMRRFAELAGGRGGGSPLLAKGAGSDPARLTDALDRASALVHDALASR